MAKWCNFRIDPKTESMIDDLAARSFRTRSEIMRMLVHIALQKSEIFFPELVVMKVEKPISQDKQDNKDNL